MTMARTLTVSHTLQKERMRCEAAFGVAHLVGAETFVPVVTS